MAVRVDSETFHTCSMCSYCSRNLGSLTTHICKSHRSDPRFNVYCKSCFRSYTKWESYRKHIQRGCKIMPCSTVNVASSSSLQLESNDEDIDVDSSLVSNSNSMPVSEKWHEARFILSMGLSTAFLQKKYFNEHFGLIVS